MTIQGSINQLLGIAAAGVGAKKHLKGQKDITTSQENIAEELRKQRIMGAEQDLSLIDKKMEQGLHTTEDVFKKAQLTETLLNLDPTEERFNVAEEASGQAQKVREAQKGFEKAKELKEKYPHVEAKKRAQWALEAEQERIRNSKLIQGGMTYGQRNTYNV